MLLPPILRAVFTVIPHPPFWAVEHGGTETGFKTREEAMAFATRQANASQNAGMPARISIADEPTLAGS